MRVLLFAAILTLSLIARPSSVGAQTKKPEPGKTAEITEFLGKKIDHWINELKNPDRAKAEFAVGAILNFSPDKAVLALPEMIRIHATYPPPLTAPKLDPSMRLALTRGIGAILAKNEKAADFQKGLERLRAALKDPQLQIKIRALESLQMLGYAAHGATKDVIDMAQDKESWEMRRAAITTLQPLAHNPKTGVSKEHFEWMYKAAEQDACYQVRLAGIDAMLRSLNLNDAKSKQEFESRLDAIASKDPEPLVQLRATWGVMLVKDDVPPKSVAQIERLMENPDPNVRFNAIETATKVGISKKNNAFIPALIKRLDDTELNVKLGAIQGLGASGKLAKNAIGVLMARIDDKDVNIQAAVISALGAMGPVASPAVPALVGKLPDVELELLVINALGGIAEGATAAVEALIGKLSDPNLNVHGAAMLALGKIGDSKAIDPLLKKSNDPNPAVQMTAFQAIGLMGVKASSVVSNLIARINDADLNVRGSVIQALGNIRSKDAVKPLIPQLSDTHTEIVEVTLVALGTIGPDAKMGAMPISRKLSDRNNRIVTLAVIALASIADMETVPELEKVADDTGRPQYIRTGARQAIDAIREKNKKTTSLEGPPPTNPPVSSPLESPVTPVKTEVPKSTTKNVPSGSRKTPSSSRPTSPVLAPETAPDSSDTEPPAPAPAAPKSFFRLSNPILMVGGCALLVAVAIGLYLRRYLTASDGDD